MIYYSRLLAGLLGGTLAVTLGNLATFFTPVFPRSKPPRSVHYLYLYTQVAATVAVLVDLVPRLVAPHGGCLRTTAGLTWFNLQSAKLANFATLYRHLTTVERRPLLVHAWARCIALGLGCLYAIILVVQTVIARSAFSREFALCAPVQEYVSTTFAVAIETFSTILCLGLALCPAQLSSPWSRQAPSSNGRSGEDLESIEVLPEVFPATEKMSADLANDGVPEPPSVPPFPTTHDYIQNHADQASNQIDSEAVHGAGCVLRPSSVITRPDEADLKPRATPPWPGFLGADPLRWSRLYSIIYAGPVIVLLILYFVRLTVHVDLLVPWFTLVIELSWTSHLLAI